MGGCCWVFISRGSETLPRQMGHKAETKVLGTLQAWVSGSPALDFGPWLVEVPVPSHAGPS